MKAPATAYTGLVKLKVYSSKRPMAALVLAHGAGAGQSSPFMVRVGTGMAERGLSTATFDFPYMSAGRKAPDRAPALEAAWREAIESARSEFEGLTLYIGGKSMGGRISSQVASQGGVGRLGGLVFLGYPLHPPGRPDQRRDAHLPAIREPMLFVQGSRDAFGSSDEIRQLLPSLQHATLEEIEGGDHSFKVPGGAGKQGAILPAIMDIVAAWVRKA
jgi:predicted alpha/beta-hydrolase family hydrolase